MKIKGKVGRPKGSKKQEKAHITVTAIEPNITQIALNQVEAVIRIGKIEMSMQHFMQALNDIMANVNKANQDIAKRITALESSVSDLQKKIVADLELMDTPQGEEH